MMGREHRVALAAEMGTRLRERLPGPKESGTVPLTGESRLEISQVDLAAEYLAGCPPSQLGKSLPRNRRNPQLVSPGLG